MCRFDVVVMGVYGNGSPARGMAVGYGEKTRGITALRTGRKPSWNFSFHGFLLPSCLQAHPPYPVPLPSGRRERERNTRGAPFVWGGGGGFPPLPARESLR